MILGTPDSNEARTICLLLLYIKINKIKNFLALPKNSYYYEKMFNSYSAPFKITLPEKKNIIKNFEMASYRYNLSMKKLVCFFIQCYLLI